MTTAEKTPVAAGPISGPPIPLSVPVLAGREAEYVADCVSSGWISSVGPYVDRLEREAAAYLGVERAVAVASGTAALHLALLVAGVEPGDEVLVSNLTFIASANPIRYAGAWPVFIGSEPDYWQISPEHLQSFLENECVLQNGALRNRRSGRRVRALLPVHILGHPVDLDPLVELAARFELALVEDCAECIGAEYRGRRTGGFGLVSAFSFNGNKIISCGGGGLVATDHGDLADRARHLSTQAKSHPAEYEHDEIGYNYRLTSLQAAVGCAQLEQLPGFIETKRALSARYRKAFEGAPGLTFMREASWARSICWLSTVLVDEQAFGLGSRELLRRLAAQGIQARPLWQPMHRSRAHSGVQAYRCEVDDRLFDCALSLPSSPNLTETDQRRVIDAILSAAC